MNNTPCITKITSNRIIIPRSLFDFMKEPESLTFIPEETGTFFIKKTSLYDYAKFPVRKVLSLPVSWPITGKFVNANKNTAAYQFLFPPQKNHISLGDYHSVNYGKLIYFIPIEDKKNEAKSRENAWSKIKNYHEHRSIELQMKNAHLVSQWLAQIFREFSPQSILEMGCGAGRNLIIASQYLPEAKLIGIDINEEAIRTAKRIAKGKIQFRVSSLYDLRKIPTNSIDVVFTSGVLMHIPHHKVVAVIREMHRIAKKAVIHFELHGPSHDFDFHRYPRDYGQLYENNGWKPYHYQIFPKFSMQSRGTNSFWHALLIYKK